jgi:hypothetical protein
VLQGLHSPDDRWSHDTLYCNQNISPFRNISFLFKIFCLLSKIVKMLCMAAICTSRTEFRCVSETSTSENVLYNSKTEKLTIGCNQLYPNLAAVRNNDYDVCRLYSTQGRQVKFIHISGRKTWWDHTVDLGENGIILKQNEGVGDDGVCWNNLALDRIRCRVVVKTVTDFRFSTPTNQTPPYKT